jgi:hypothetical protein
LVPGLVRVLTTRLTAILPVLIILIDKPRYRLEVEVVTRVIMCYLYVRVWLRKSQKIFLPSFWEYFNITVVCRMVTKLTHNYS